MKSLDALVEDALAGLRDYNSDKSRNQAAYAIGRIAQMAYDTPQPLRDEKGRFVKADDKPVS